MLSKKQFPGDFIKIPNSFSLAACCTVLVFLFDRASAIHTSTEEKKIKSLLKMLCQACFGDFESSSPNFFLRNQQLVSHF